MKHIYLFCISILIFTSCQEDLTASWLAVDEINFTTNEALEGPNTHSIVDAWVYIDNQSMGVWEIPFKMPVLEEGEHTVLIIPGIQLNGISETRVTNSFYEAYTTTINLTKEQTTTITPSFKYKSTINIIAKEDFEDTGVILNPNTSEDTTKFKIISKTDYPDIVKYGSNCGMLHLTSADTLVKVITDLNLPIVQEKMYLELDYLSTNAFTVGIINETAGSVASDQGPHVGAYKTNKDKFEWKKLYFPLSSHINLNPYATYFEFYLLSVLDNDKLEGDIYIDNIKIVYF